MSDYWIKEANFYHIYPLGFCGCPQFHIQEIKHSIKKIIDWIPHMQSMHLNAVYLGPVFASYEHGYDTSDYRIIDSRLGSNEDFKDVCDALHKAGIKIVLDGVFNHVGRHFWAFLDVKEKREQSPYASWFHNINFHQNSPMGDDFTYQAWEGHYNLVKLNLKNDDVVNYLLDSVGMWMDEFHIDGLRLDAADCIDKDFFKKLKTFTKQKDSQFWLMGEIIHGDYTMWANSEMLDSVTNYECYKGLYSSHNTKNYFEIAHSLQRQFGKGGIYKDLTLYNFVDNHDVNRLASVVENPKDLTNIYTLMYTMPGIPSIYYGSEFALTGKKHDGSDADIRPCLDLANLCATASPIYEHIKKLGAIYSENQVLSLGSYEQVVVKNEQFVFQRSTEHDLVYIALNLSDDVQTITFKTNETNLYDELHEQSYKVDGELTLIMQPHDSYILCKPKKQRKQNPPRKECKTAIPEIIRQSIKQPKVDVVQLEKQEIETTILPGRYRHFKGKDYAVLYVATHSETQENYVVYRQLYGDGNVWVRPLAMFKESVEIEGKKQPRFSYLGK